MKLIEVWALIAPILTFIYGYSHGIEIGKTDGRAEMYKEIKQNVRA